MAQALPYILIIAAYLIGSIPFSFLVVKIVAGADIRAHGSRNVGATNVARNFGKVPGIVALLLDIAKGYAAVALARWIVSRADWPYVTDSAHATPLYSMSLWIALAALIAVLAHMYPVWLRFHGGKGVATAAGVLIALDWRVGTAVIVVWLAVAAISRYSSLGAIVAAVFAPVATWFFLGTGPVLAAVVGMSVILVVRHKANILKLARGEERRIGAAS
jgi:glycerol-3-phosphate acyltransferase PlsY